MKVIGDVSSFLKRTAGALTMQHDGKVFIVKHGEMSARSQYLDDALESIAEETRRRANGMQTMRDDAKPEPAKGGGGSGGGYVTVTLSGVKPPSPANPPLPSISQAAQQAYQQQAAKAACANCSGRGFVTSGGFLFLCPACNP